MAKKAELTFDAAEILKNFKPGQKKPTPAPASGTRVFYESLYKQRKSSLMALQWCVTYGVLPREDCEAAVEELERRKKQKKEQMASAGATSAAASSSSSNHAVKKEKKEKKKKKHKHKHKHRKRAEFDDGGDFQEGVGTTNL